MHDEDDEYPIVENGRKKEELEILILRLKELKALIKKSKNSRILLMMIHVFLISALEIFLRDVFKNTLDDLAKQKFIKVHKKHKNAKIKRYEIYSKQVIEGVDDWIYEELTKMDFLEFEEVAKHFEESYGVKFGNIKDIKDEIIRRNGFIHRWGLDMTGREISIDKDGIKVLYNRIKDFCIDIDMQILMYKKIRSSPRYV